MKANALAFDSMNKLSYTIKNTLQKGTTLIRSQKKQIKQQKSQKTIKYISNQFDHQQQLNALKLYEKIKIYAGQNQRIKKNIINIFNYAQVNWQQFISINNKTGVHYNQYLQKFKLVEFKLNKNLNKILTDKNIDLINSIKMQIKRIIDYLNQRARKFIDKNKQIVNLIKKKQKQQVDQESQEEAIKQQMLELLDRLKGQAINMGSDLKKDNIVIQQIHKKQDKQLNTLQTKTNSLQDIINSQKIGFFKLVSMAVMGIMAWIFTLLFIIIF